MLKHREKVQAFMQRVLTRLKHTDQLVLVGVFVVTMLVILVAMILPKFVYRTTPEGVEGQGEASDDLLYRHPLTGVAISEQEEGPPQVFAVVIDNHEASWPLSGIDQSFLVIEAPVEAGIPRLLAFFLDDQEVPTIGPVRSARPYYLDWAAELDALFVHVGGSNAALDMIASGGTFDLNQYWWDEYFWRASDRYAPHNVYTSTELLKGFYAMRTEQGLAPERLYGLWSFKNPEPSESESKLHIDFYPPIYTVDWEYVPDANLYRRYQSGEIHTTDASAHIQADNVVVVMTDVKIIDSIGRREIRTVGEGEGYVLQDGRVIEIVWKKPSKSERLVFYRRDTGEEIAMNAGITWIEVVPSTKESITIE